MGVAATPATQSMTFDCIIMKITIARRRMIHVCAFFLSIALQPLCANAQTLSCGGNVVSVGESRLSISQKCGDPAVRELICIPGKPEDRYVGVPGSGLTRVPSTPPCVQMEEWTYHRGPGNFLAIVRFENGVVESLRDGERMR
jgi:hypothetical protein